MGWWAGGLAECNISNWLENNKSYNRRCNRSSNRSCNATSAGWLAGWWAGGRVQCNIPNWLICEFDSEFLLYIIEVVIEVVMGWVVG